MKVVYWHTDYGGAGNRRKKCQVARELLDSLFKWNSCHDSPDALWAFGIISVFSPTNEVCGKVPIVGIFQYSDKGKVMFTFR